MTPDACNPNNSESSTLYTWKLALKCNDEACRARAVTMYRAISPLRAYELKFNGYHSKRFGF